MHLVNSLGYDLLFQDLDIVWFQNPVDFFLKDKRAPKNYDMYFQHDGTHHPERFAPLAANTGMYYVKHNDRTEHFFSVFVRMGDLVLAEKSHQAALTTLVNDQMNEFGLRVRVLSKHHFLFLCKFPLGSCTIRCQMISLTSFMFGWSTLAAGYHLHSERHLIQKMVDKEIKPYLFHANWLKGNQKRPRLEYTHNWFVHKQCDRDDPNKLLGLEGGVLGGCCVAEAWSSKDMMTTKLAKDSKGKDGANVNKSVSSSA